MAHDRVSGFFMCCAQSHLNGGACGGAVKLAGFIVTGSSNPVRLATHKRGNFGGELLAPATLPAHTSFEYPYPLHLLIIPGYSSLVAVNPVTGLRIPEFDIAHNRASSGFFMRAAFVHLSMVAQAGASSEAPGSMSTGNANPVWATTNHGFASVGGSYLTIDIEAATMATIPTLVQPEITVINGQAVTSSIAVANYFIKRHDNVVQKIKNLECSPNFTALNFKASEYQDSTGRKLPLYEMTKDGFVFLVMGFTGKKAAAFKEAYIAEFNRMEAELHRSESRDIIQGDGHSLLIHFDKNHQISFTEKVPANAIVATIENVMWWMEKQGYRVMSKHEIKDMTLGQLLSWK